MAGKKHKGSFWTYTNYNSPNQSQFNGNLGSPEFKGGPGLKIFMILLAVCIFGSLIYFAFFK